jgi:hypothetical protein
MTGGTITNNGSRVNQEGGGVFIDGSSAAFNLSGGTISSNNSYKGGGVCVERGTFIMTGGTISNNYASMGGGVFVTTAGSFIKTSGSITGNDAGTDFTANGKQACVHVLGTIADYRYRDANAGATVNLNSSNNTNWTYYSL